MVLITIFYFDWLCCGFPAARTGDSHKAEPGKSAVSSEFGGPVKAAGGFSVAKTLKGAALRTIVLAAYRRSRPHMPPKWLPKAVHSPTTWLESRSH